MALKAFYSTQDEVPEALREQYVEAKVGDKSIFKLDVEQVGGWDLQDIAGLTSTVGRLKEQTPRLKAFEDLSLSPTDLRTTIDELATLRESGGKSESERNTRLLQDIDGLKTGRDKGITDATAPLQTRVDALVNQLENILVHTALTESIAKAGGGEALELLRPALARFVQTSTDDDTNEMRALVIDDEGHPRIGGDLLPFTFDALVDEKKQLPAFAPAFVGSGQSGRGTDGDGERKNQSTPMTEDQIASMSQAEYKQAREPGGVLADI